MRTTWLLVLALLAGALLGAPGAEARRSRRAKAPEPPPFTVVELDDGMTLVHVRPEGADRASLRYGIGAGGFEDPLKKGGLAHMLEHLIFHGTYDIPEGKLFEDARARGGQVNAFTSTPWTIYALDAPPSDFLPLMSMYVRMVTNPALRLAELERERKVVDAEHTYRGVKSLLWAFDQQVFPSANRGQTVIGTGPSRKNVTLEDLLEFYERHYVPSNTVVVVVADLPLAEVRRTLEESVLQPPDPPLQHTPEPPRPNVPSSTRIRSWTTAITSAYHLPDVEPAVCDDIAALVDLRLMERVRLQEPLASGSLVMCHRTRGTSFLVALAWTRTLQGSRLPEIMKLTMLETKRRPPTSKERAIIQSRWSGYMTQLVDDPGELATVIASEVTPGGDDVEERIRRLFERPKLDWRAMRAALEKNLVDDHHVLVQFSPFEED